MSVKPSTPETRFGMGLLEIERRILRMRGPDEKDTLKAKIIFLKRVTLTVNAYNQDAIEINIEALLDRSSLRTVTGRKRKRKKGKA